MVFIAGPFFDANQSASTAMRLFAEAAGGRCPFTQGLGWPERNHTPITDGDDITRRFFVACPNAFMRATLAAANVAVF